MSQDNPGRFEDEPAEADYRLDPDYTWDNFGIDPSALDPNFRLVVSLLEELEFEQLFLRTGIRVDHDGTVRHQELPLFLELSERAGIETEFIPNLLKKLEPQGVILRVARSYSDDVGNDPRLRYITARLLLDDAELSSESKDSYGLELRRKFATLIKSKEFARVSLPTPLQPCAEESLRDMALPADRKFNARTLDGKGVIVGVIDDGCALAHADFLVPGTIKSRIQYLWDPSRTDPAGGWTMRKNTSGIPDFNGLELTNSAINNAIAAHTSVGVIDEVQVYEHVNYAIDDLQSHGTHVIRRVPDSASLLGRDR